MRLILLAVFVSFLACTASQARFYKNGIVHFYQRGDDYQGAVARVDDDSVEIQYFVGFWTGVYSAHVTLDKSQVSPEISCFEDICKGKKVHFSSPIGDMKMAVRRVFANGRVCLVYLSEGPKKEVWASVGQVSDEIIGAGGFMASDCVRFGGETGVVSAVFRNSMAEVRFLNAGVPRTILVDTSKLTTCLKAS